MSDSAATLKKSLLVGACAALVAIITLARRPSRRAAPAPAAAAPEFALADLGGQVVSLSRYHGQVVLLNFWASWCASCRAETPALNALQERLKGRGFTVLALSVDEGGRKPVMSFVARYNPSFPIALADRRTAEAYGVFGLPVSFLLDRSGAIRRTYHGPIDEAAVENDILGLVSKS